MGFHSNGSYVTCLDMRQGVRMLAHWHSNGGHFEMLRRAVPSNGPQFEMRAATAAKNQTEAFGRRPIPKKHCRMEAHSIMAWRVAPSNEASIRPVLCNPRPDETEALEWAAHSNVSRRSAFLNLRGSFEWASIRNMCCASRK